MGTFREISPYALDLNAFQSIGKEWMLVAAQKEGRVNMLTASWGGMGFLWNRPVAFVFIRPQRYTKEFVDQAGRFSLNFFGPGCREQLNLCGTQSGRDIDKVKACGFQVLSEGDVPYFAQDRTAVICRTLSVSPMQPSWFLDPSIDPTFYPEHDHHIMYIGEIEKVLVRDE